MTDTSEIPNNHLAPHPVVRHTITVVQKGQTLTPEQRERISTWLRANGVDPQKVARDEITVTYRMCGTRPGRKFIGFQQFYLEDGSKVHAAITNGVVKFQRHVEQSVELEPDPAWEGWEKHDAQMAERRAQHAKEDR